MIPDIGFSELLLIILVVLVVGKPEDVPVVMRRVGLVLAHTRHFVAGMWAGWRPLLLGEPEAEPQPSAETPVAPKRPRNKGQKV